MEPMPMLQFDSDEQDEREFVSSLFPMVSSQRRAVGALEVDGQEVEVEVAMPELDLGMQMVDRPGRRREPVRQPVRICGQLVFVSPEGTDVEPGREVREV